MAMISSRDYLDIENYPRVIFALDCKWIAFAEEECVTKIADISKLVFIVTNNTSLLCEPISEVKVYLGYIIGVDEDDSDSDEDESCVEMVELKEVPASGSLTSAVHTTTIDERIIDIIKISDQRILQKFNGSPEEISRVATTKGSADLVRALFSARSPAS